ncbi:hypothetical protein D3C87_1150050 [compost metagenome]
MTYVIYDGKTLIADKLVKQTVGGYMCGRRQRDAEGFYKPTGSSSTVPIYYRDACKIFLMREGKFLGQKIKAIAIAGTINNVEEMLNAVEAGCDLDSYMTVDVNIQPNSARRIFNGKTSIMVITEDNVGAVFTSNGRTIHKHDGPPMHMGCGAEVVNGINYHLEKPATALEAHTLASTHDEQVSLEFDYYIPETGTFVRDQKLSDRQRKHILKKIQSRINVVTEPLNSTYIN